MNIPREHSICQNVVVVGGVGDVARRKLSSLTFWMGKEESLQDGKSKMCQLSVEATETCFDMLI